ncbi:multidrug effflux MFS transporter [Francisella sp. Scap27]|uniref:multidrug effflux MFS transporter n=1 Tax=Francisella sp. Scap27 TaxID=2589986 RepID=UPI0015BCAA2D|nr:multidrug effflux MFS transporter [Francisella sp. Scap27]QLE79851.1 multidrug effflux MFS transporter [Francisella sp. Scap27]
MIANDKKDFIRYMIILAMMSSMGLLASDIYLPAMPSLSEALSTTDSSLQLTLGVYLFGLAISQIFVGFLSDIYGRRKILLIGFLIYVIASICCSFSSSIQTLIVFRFIQAIGASTGLVVGRATISDQFSLKEATNIYNIIYPIVAISPAIAPLIGGYIATFFGWQATFEFVAIYGIILLIISFFFLKETNLNREPKKLFHIFHSYPLLISNTAFLSYVIPVCLVYGAWFTYLSQSTFLFDEMGYSQHTIGYFYIPLAIMIYIGNLIGKKLMNTLGNEKVFYIGLFSFLYGGLLFFIFNLSSNMNHAFEIIIPMSIVSISNGIVLPLGIASAINIFKEKSGVASGLVGFAQIGFSGLCASFIGKLFGISTSVLMITVLIMSILAILSHHFLKEQTKD